MPAFPQLPPISREPLSVVLLARDNAAHVRAVVTDWLAFLDARGQDYELLVVDDGSCDDTAGQVNALASPRVRLLRHDKPRGEGAALRTGLQAVRHPLVFYTLCRPEYRPDDLGKLLKRPFPHEAVPGGPPAPTESDREIDHVHLIGGIRAGVKVPRPLRALGWLWRLFCRVVFSYAPAPLPGWLGFRRYLGWLLARIIFGLRYHDVLCPFRLLRRDILRRIPIQSDGPFAHAELLAKANFLGCVMGEEQPLDVIPGPYRGDFRPIWQEAMRVFRRPDFGPPFLPDQPEDGLTSIGPLPERGDGITAAPS